MDTSREQKQLEALWQSGDAPWIIEPKARNHSFY
jgi:hypothetical protein